MQTNKIPDHYCGDALAIAARAAEANRDKKTVRPSTSYNPNQGEPIINGSKFPSPPMC